MSEKMAVRVTLRPRATLGEFAVAHGLTMEVRERSHRHIQPAMRFYARFGGAEIRTGLAGLLTAAGDGATPEEAIADYARRISEELLIVDAFLDTRREIDVPIIVPNDSEPEPKDTP